MRLEKQCMVWAGRKATFLHINFLFKSFLVWVGDLEFISYFSRFTRMNRGIFINS